MSTSETLNRLVSAALVSERFRNRLLSNPLEALKEGYNGEQFDLPPEVMEAIATIHAADLPDFANELVMRCNGNGNPAD